MIVGAGMLGTDAFVSAADGRRLRTMTAGESDDLVVLEAGLGMSGLFWGPVHARVAEHARVAAYERSGYGASDPDESTRDLAHLADDLLGILDAQRYRRLVLVGHSWGGPVVRVVAARLASSGRTPLGVVLVDQSDEHAASLYDSSAGRAAAAMQRALMVPLARMGLLASATRATAKGLPRPLLDAVATASSTAAAARATAAELAHVAGGMRDLAGSPPDLSGVGISVLSGMQHTVFDRRVRARLVAAHRETAAEHPGGRLVAAERSGHLIPITEPALVVQEALRFFE